MHQCVSWHRKGQPWEKRQCVSVSEHCCPDWRDQWYHAIIFRNHVWVCMLVYTVLVRLDWCSVRGAWAPSPAMGFSLWPFPLTWAAVQRTGEVFAISPLQSVQLWVSGYLVAEMEADSARTTFSCLRGYGRDVLPLVRGRRGAKLPLVCFLPSSWDWGSSLPALKILKLEVKASANHSFLYS